MDDKYKCCPSHCCQVHGCKYGFPGCPVATKQIIGSTGSCEQCGLEQEGYYGSIENDEAWDVADAWRKAAHLYFKIAEWFAAHEPGTPVPEWCELSWPLEMTEVDRLVEEYRKDRGRKVTESFHII